MSIRRLTIEKTATNAGVFFLQYSYGEIENINNGIDTLRIQINIIECRLCVMYYTYNLLAIVLFALVMHIDTYQKLFTIDTN